MSAATIVVPPAAPVPHEAAPVPLYTRHMLGAIEAERDRRIQARHHYVHWRPEAHLRLVPAGDLERWDGEGGWSPADTFPPARMA